MELISRLTGVSTAPSSSSLGARRSLVGWLGSSGELGSYRRDSEVAVDDPDELFPMRSKNTTWFWFDALKLSLSRGNDATSFQWLEAGQKEGIFDSEILL